MVANTNKDEHILSRCIELAITSFTSQLTQHLSLRKSKYLEGIAAENIVHQPFVSQTFQRTINPLSA